MHESDLDTSATHDMHGGNSYEFRKTRAILTLLQTIDGPFQFGRIGKLRRISVGSDESDSGSRHTKVQHLQPVSYTHLTLPTTPYV